MTRSRVPVRLWVIVSAPVDTVFAAFTQWSAQGDWRPGPRVDVVHAGRFVQGTGTMEVLALPGDRSRFVWSEEFDLPLGTVGRIGWPVARAVFLAGVDRSLEAFGRLVESGALPR